MKNFVAQGEAITFSNTGAAIASGDVVTFGAAIAEVAVDGGVVAAGSIGVATTNIAATTGKGAVALEGVFRLKLKTGVTPAVGDPVFWDGTAKEITDVAVGAWPAGIVYSLPGSAQVDVKLQPIPLAGGVTS